MRASSTNSQEDNSVAILAIADNVKSLCLMACVVIKVIYYCEPLAELHEWL